MNHHPANYLPSAADDFVGPARRLARLLLEKVGHAQRDGSSLRILLVGPPGVGKTEMVNLAARTLTGHGLAVEEYNGKEVLVETVRGWMSSLGYGNLFSDWTVKIVNELDKCSRDAQDLLLTYLDRLRRCPYRAFLATSNQTLDLFGEAVQTRYQQFTVANCPTDELADWLVQRWSIDVATARAIAFGSGGNVRAALLDAQSHLDALALLDRAA